MSINQNCLTNFESLIYSDRYTFLRIHTKYWLIPVYFVHICSTITSTSTGTTILDFQRINIERQTLKLLYFFPSIQCERIEYENNNNNDINMSCLNTLRVIVLDNHKGGVGFVKVLLYYNFILFNETEQIITLL